MWELLHPIGMSLVLYGVFFSLNINNDKLHIIAIFLSFYPSMIGILFAFQNGYPIYYFLIAGIFALLSGVFTFFVSIRYGGNRNGEKKL